MSRTQKGRKRPNTELWSKRASKAGVVGWRPSKDAKVITHRMERIQSKKEVSERKQEIGDDGYEVYYHTASDD